ncbi:MAG: S-methyl-5-thioribose-1-phosphate isomerase [Acidimicrobiales bacterium]
MNIDGQPYRTIWRNPDDPNAVQLIDQRLLPFEFAVVDVRSSSAMAAVIADMVVRGAGLIGAAAGYGMMLAAVEAVSSGSDDRRGHLEQAAAALEASRPTAVNLTWAVRRQLAELDGIEDADELVRRAGEVADQIADEDAEWCRRIGEHGRPLLETIHQRTGETVNVLTHCNAGWLAFVDHGTATAPIYAAHDAGVPVHVWVDETRPRNQGARLTAWELGQHGVPHTVIVDNAGGHLMQHGQVDLVITGSDRTTFTGDVANKIGTYLKALAAHDNDVPFYVALPSSTIDWETRDGVRGTPIEERDPAEVTHIGGALADTVADVRLTPEGTAAANYGFDVTPARLVTGLITERGLCAADEDAIGELYPEYR